MKKITLSTALLLLIAFFSLPSYGQESATKEKELTEQTDFFRRTLGLDQARAAAAARVQVDYKANLAALVADSSLSEGVRRERIKQLIETKDAKLAELHDTARQENRQLGRKVLVDSIATENRMISEPLKD